MKKLLFFLLIGSSLVSVSCSSDEDSPKASAIVLTSSAASVDLGKSVTLTAIDDLKQDITSTAVFTANGITLESKVFTPKTAGSYKITAKKDGIVSNEIVVTVNTVATSIVLSATATTVDLGSSVTLKVLNDLSQDVTSTSTFTANGTSITGAAFTATAAGTYRIVAKNGTLTSNEITVTVKEVVAVENSIFTGGKNYAVSNSAIEFIAKAAADGSATATHAVFRLVAYNSSSDYSAIKATLPSNTISLTFLVPLSASGEVLAPNSSNIILPKIELLITDGNGATITSKEEATLTFNSALPSTKNAPFSFKATAKFNKGSNVELNFNGNLNGLY